MESPKLNPDDIFVKNWTKNAHKWMFLIRSSTAPEKIQSELEAAIEGAFIEGYLKNIGRKDSDVLIFLEIIQDKINEIKDPIEREQIREMIDKDIKILVTANRN